MEEQFNKEAKQGRRFVAGTARITDECAADEGRKHTSGEVFVAIDSNLGAVIGKEEGAVTSIPGDEGRIAQAWVNLRGGVRVFAVYLWHSEGWTPRNDALMEALVKQPRVTRHPWLIACDANINPEDFKKSLWCKSRHMFIEAPGERISTRRSKGPNGESIERAYDHVIASQSLQGKIKKLKSGGRFRSKTA